MTATPLETVRRLCLALPETTERPGHGTPSFFVRGKKCFAIYPDDHHGDGRRAVWCAAPFGAQQALTQDRPDVFFVPPYVGHRGWLGVCLDKGLEEAELSAILLGLPVRGPQAAVGKAGRPGRGKKVEGRG